MVNNVYKTSFVTISLVIVLGSLFSSVSLAQTSVIYLKQVNSAYQQRLEIIPNFVAVLKSTGEIEDKLISEVSTARLKAATFWLTPEMLKDSLAFQKFEKNQDGLSSAISKLLIVLEQKKKLTSQKDIYTLLCQLEAQENRIHIERLRYNEFTSTFPKDSHYQLFKGNSAGSAPQVTFAELSPSPPVKLTWNNELSNSTKEPILKTRPHFWIDSGSRENPYEQLTDTPKVITSSQLVYPEKAKKQGIQGSLSYSALIDIKGNIEKVVIDSTDAEIFDKAVIESVMKCKFTPGKVKNRKVKVWITGTVRFTLTETVMPPTQH